MSISPQSKTLFNETSLHVSDYSLVLFSFRSQATIQGVGLGPDDVITFEVVHLKSGTADEYCGCFVRPGELPSIVGTETMMCVTCDSKPTPVSLTFNNPVVVLNAPQNTLIRAKFEGPGLGSAEVWATLETDTTHLLPGMDGCLPEPCDEDEWNETGLERCEDHVLQVQQINDCGDMRWEDTDRSCGWIPTYEFPCGGLGFRPEDDVDPEATVEMTGCDGADGPIVYIYPEPNEHASKPIYGCTTGGCEEGEILGYAFEDGRADCDPCAPDHRYWVPTGVSKQGGDLGPRYAVSDQYVNGCGTLDWRDGASRPWQDTGAIRCVGATVQKEQKSDFGQSKWVYQSSVVWSATGVTRPGPAGVQSQESNQCGDLRWIDSEAYSWTDTGDIRCSMVNDVDVEVQQVNQLGLTRWQTSATVTQAWVETGLVKCLTSDDETYSKEVQEVNQCGNLRWVEDPTPLDWMDTGLTRCVGRSEEKQQSTICGDLRWITDGESYEWDPSLSLPDGGLAFDPLVDDVDPAASVALEDCDGNVIAYIYPVLHPEFYNIPVYTCDNDLLGYAVSASALHCGPTPTAVAVTEVCGVPMILWSDGTLTTVNCP